MEPVQADLLVLAAESVEMLQAAVTVAEQAECSGRKKWFISAGAAAAVVVVGGGVMLSHQADPKDTVIDAFKSIDGGRQLNPSEEIFGTKELEKLLQKGSAQTGMELSMTGISDESLNQMSGAGIGLDVKRDVDSGRQLLNLSLQYGGGELADAQLYMDDTQIMAAIPALSSRMFTLDYVNDLEGQLINSPYAAQKLEEQGIDIEGLANLSGTVQGSAFGRGADDGSESTLEPLQRGKQGD